MHTSEYRQGETAERVAKLEDALRERDERVAKLERALWATRKQLRPRRALGVAAAAGLGCLGGAVLGGVALALLDNPWFLIAGTGAGAVLGVIIHGAWRAPEDGFPEAPPDRHY